MRHKVGAHKVRQITIISCSPDTQFKSNCIYLDSEIDRKISNFSTFEK